MTFALYRRTKSLRLTVTPPDGAPVVVENLEGDQGFRVEFEARRSMDERPGEFSVTAYNLPPDALGAIEAAQVRRVDDLDALLVGAGLQSQVVAADGSDALAAGFCVVELEAGYDGVLSRVFRAVGATIESDRVDGDVTSRVVLTAAENLDGVLLGLPQATFPAGTTTYEVVDYLRRLAGLGPGNLTPATLAAILGDSKLSSPYHVSGGQALGLLQQVLQYLSFRWFVDDREIWICGRDGVVNAGGVPPWVADEVGEPEPLLGRPRRRPGGSVEAECLLCPRLRVGRLVRLSEAGLALALQGLSPDEQQVARAQVPPGLYRLDGVAHGGTTGDGPWDTRMTLRPVTAPP